MRRKPKAKRRAASTAVRRTTMVAFTAEDLNVLAKVLKAGQVLLPTKHPVIWRLKATMTRMGVPTE